MYTMARSTLIVVVSCVSLAARGVSAQSLPSLPCAATPITLSVGVSQSDRVDNTVSPMQFHGRGVDVAGSAEHAAGAWCFAAEARGGTKTLTSSVPSAAREQLAEGDASLALLRAISPLAAARHALALGLEARGDLAFTQHLYADPAGTQSRFRVVVLSLGPTARWRGAVPGGWLNARLSTPLVSLVDHPSADLTANAEGPNFRTATFSSLRSVNGQLSYEVGLRKNLSLVAAYRFSTMRFDDLRPVRSLSQMLTLGVVRRAGGSR
jgi:hypothetical protein